ncbi:MAG: IS66 family transposase [Acidobacteriota bacterium]
MEHDLQSLQAQVRVLNARLLELERQEAAKDELIRKLQHQLAQALRRQYGQKADRVDPNQLFLDICAQVQAVAQSAEPPPAPPEDPTTPPTPPDRKGHGRRPIPAHVERRTEIHDLSSEEKRCAFCGREKRCIGEECSCQYEFVPARLIAVEHVQKKYACVCVESTVTTASKPSSPIEKGLAAPSLLSHLIVSKYLDHLPLHRQEGMLARSGIEYPRSTMWEQIRAAGQLMTPLYEAATVEVLASRVLGTDDTPVKVLDRDRTTTRTGNVWTYVGDAAHPLIVYDYTAGRARAGPEAFLGDYTGYLQADALAAYDELYNPRRSNLIWELGCWAHARRYFVEAQDTSPALAVIAVAHIKVLYDIEKDAARRERRGDALVAWRKEHSVPVLDAFRRWLTDQVRILLPKSPIATAIGYTLSNWEALARYVEDGDLVLDNNRSERALRGIAVGRKNWLFFGSDGGGKIAAIMLTLLKSAQRNGINPFDYLTDVLTRIADYPRSKVADLLPHRWQAARESAATIEQAH